MLKTALQAGKTRVAALCRPVALQLPLGVPRAEASTDERPETLLVSGGRSVAYDAQSRLTGLAPMK